MFWNGDIDPDNPPAKVLLKRGEFIDAARISEEHPQGRPVAWKLYYPALDTPQKCPVIVWSHGFGGNRDGASFLSRFMAAQGYVVFHPTHHGTDSSLWEGKPGHPWDILRTHKTPRSASINRFYDIPFALDELQKWAADNPDVGAIMDFDQLGMSGHSFGAMTTQVVAGQPFPNEGGSLESLGEQRFKAGISYSPVPIGHLTDAPPSELYGAINIPLLHMTGTDDDSPVEGYGYEHRLSIYEYTDAAEKFLLIKNDGDHMVYNGTRGKLGANPNRAQHEALIKIFSLAFWDAYLKGDGAAMDWIKGQGAQNYITTHGQFHKG